jgi:hypothetical protein
LETLSTMRRALLIRSAGIPGAGGAGLSPHSKTDGTTASAPSSPHELVVCLDVAFDSVLKIGHREVLHGIIVCSRLWLLGLSPKYRVGRSDVADA